MPNIQIKPSNPNNLPAIMAMERSESNRRFVGQSTQTEHLQTIKNKNTQHLSIFDKDDKLIGFIILINTQNRNVELKRIVIDDKQKGYGLASLEWVKRYVFETLNAERLWLDVYAFNVRAQHVYKKAGFTIDEIKKDTHSQKTKIFFSIDSKKLSTTK